MGVMLALLFVLRLHADVVGVGLAIASGALTSGLGYVVWYAALRRLSALRAAVVQLSVPLIAAVGGVLLLGEAFSLRLGVAALAILGGIGLVLGSRAGGERD
jgi:drug/metabolite transporter (DMT)-like permease